MMGEMLRRTSLPATLLAVLVTALGVAGAAEAAAAKPDAHDRALALQLNHRVTVFRAIAAKANGGDTQSSLDNCAVIKKDPSKAFAAAIAILPAMLVQLVNEAKPELTQVHDMLAGMHPDSKLFRNWVGAERSNLEVILSFDNHGAKIDLCQAATVMLSKSSTADDVHRVLGIDPALIAKLFSGGSSSGSADLTRLNPQMRKFFVAAGLSPKDASTLTK
jgi:hypothetical protein